jgi:hypothetical protein
MQPALPHSSPGVLFQPVPDGAVLLDTRSEVYFGLNAVGARIWQLLPPRTETEDELCAAVAAAYPDAAPERVRADVAGLLRALAEAGLVTAAEGPARTDDAAALAGAAA